jgi:chromate transporter
MERAEATDGPGGRDQPPDAPHPSIGALYLAFAEIALSSFGGAVAWARRILVERRGWLSEREFALCQAIPGPSLVNLSIYLGTRWHGIPGAIAAASGLIFTPLVVLLPLGILYAQGSELEVVRTALRGVAAVASGFLLASGLKMALVYRREPWAIAIGGIALVAVGVLRLPLLAVLLVLAPISITIAWRRAA